MDPQPDPLLDVAAAVADGSGVDWARVAAGDSGPEPRQLADQLRLIEMIAAVHRSQSDDEPQAQTSEHDESDLRLASTPRVEIPPQHLGRWGDLVLLEEVGEGSFGTVYRAHDPQLDRDVAVKLLRPTPSREELARRLLHEGRTLAQVRHPNVVTVYGAGERDGRVGLWMEFVRGLTLEQMLVRHGRFSASEATVIGLDLCGALSAVHHAGLLHRDVKAQNVMREEGGRLVLMDFGAGQKRTDAAGSARVVGTPLYLAPEVLAGGEATIQSDVYSLGVLLYHLVTKHFPVHAATVSGLRAAHARGDVTTLQDARPDLHRTFVRVVERAIDPDPAKRFANVHQMEAALGQLHDTATTRTGAVKPETVSAEPSIAVLPFANTSGDHSDEYFSDGLTDEIINVLARIPGLKVTARTSAFAVRGKETDIRRVAAVLGVRTILEGSVRRSGSRVRVTAQLVNAADGYYLWSDRYDREMADVFAIQDEIAAAIVAALQIKLDLGAAARRRHEPALPAYEAYLKAQYHQWKFTPESLALSKEQYEKALAIDPRFALPHVGIAAYFLVGADRSFIPAHQAMPLARAAARKALDMDPSLPEAHAVLGAIAAVYDYDWGEAERQFQAAMRSDPVPPLVRHWYSFFFLAHIGRPAEALVENQRALEQDPLNPVFRLALAMSLRAIGKFEEADAELRQILEIEPRFSVAWMVLAIDSWRRGMLHEAVARAEDAHRCAPSNPQIVGVLAALLANSGETARADAFVQQLGEGDAPGAALGLFIFNLLRGNVDRAADWVAKAIAQRHPQAVQALNATILRASPHWAPLARTVNLPGTGESR